MEGEYGLYYDKHKMCKEEEDEEIEHPDIKHVAPQHRQFLGNAINNFDCMFNYHESFFIDVKSSC